jgi:hypothetical protein
LKTRWLLIMLSWGERGGLHWRARFASVWSLATQSSASGMPLPLLRGV